MSNTLNTNNLRNEQHLESVPKTGALVDPLELFRIPLDLPALGRRVKAAFRNRDTEAKLLVIQEIVSIPFKAIISLASLLKNASILIKAATVITIGVTATVFITGLFFAAFVATIAHIAFEWVKTISMVNQSVAFEKQEQLHPTVLLLRHLRVRHPKDQKLLASFLHNQKKQAKEILGAEDFNLLLAGRYSRQDALQIRAKVTATKIARLHHKYFSTNQANTNYFSRRVTKDAAAAFARAARTITLYDTSTLKRMTEEELGEFSSRGLKLLSLVDRRRKKVLDIHLFSLGVLGAATASLIALLGFGPAYFALAAPAGEALSFCRTLALNAYLKHTGKGINARLLVPKSFVPKEGEKPFHIWRGLSTTKKVFYVVFAILSAGLLPLFDGYIYKTEWIKRLRGDGDLFISPKSLFKEGEFTLLDPPPKQKTSKEVPPQQRAPKIEKRKTVKKATKKQKHTKKPLQAKASKVAAPSLPKGCLTRCLEILQESTAMLQTITIM